jgi:hypothetical protein
MTVALAVERQPEDNAQTAAPAKKRRRTEDEEVAGLPIVVGKMNFGDGTHTKKTDGSEVDVPTEVSVTFHDGRADPSRFSLDDHGFQLIDAPGLAEVACGIDVYNPDAFVEHFFPAAEEFVLRHCHGATRAIAFDHIMRNKDRLTNENIDPSQVESTKTPFLSGVLANVHGDYTARSGYSRAKQLLAPFVDGDMLKQALDHRFAIVNLWIPFERVQVDPLGLCTWRSISPSHVCTNRMTFRHRVAETYKVSFSPEQRWVFFSEVEPTEAILLKTFDTQKDDHTSRFCIHSAFRPDEQDDQLPCRKSVEVRLLVLWGEGQENLARNFVPPHVIPESADNADELNGNALLKKESIPQVQDW